MKKSVWLRLVCAVVQGIVVGPFCILVFSLADAADISLQEKAVAAAFGFGMLVTAALHMSCCITTIIGAWSDYWRRLIIILASIMDVLIVGLGIASIWAYGVESFPIEAALLFGLAFVNGLAIYEALANPYIPPEEKRCPDCSYDLRGCTEEGCPECGWGRKKTAQ